MDKLWSNSIVYTQNNQCPKITFCVIKYYKSKLKKIIKLNKRSLKDNFKNQEHMEL